MLAEASPYLERFFGPYNQLLRQIIHPSFGWSKKDHRKRPLNATQKAKMLDEAWKYRLFLRRRQVSKRIIEREKADDIREANKRRISPRSTSVSAGRPSWRFTNTKAARGSRRGKNMGRGKNAGVAFAETRGSVVRGKVGRGGRGTRASKVSDA